MRREADELLLSYQPDQVDSNFVDTMRKPAKTRGFSLIELLIVVAIILILASLAIPNLLRARRSANEASAVASVRAISSGQLVYRHTQGVFTTLAALGTEYIVDDVLASGAKSGFNFSSAAGALPDNEFTVEAAPAISSGVMATGTRFFFVNEDQVIRFNRGAPANSTSSPLTD